MNLLRAMRPSASILVGVSVMLTLTMGMRQSRGLFARISPATSP